MPAGREADPEVRSALAAVRDGAELSQAERPGRAGRSRKRRVLKRCVEDDMTCRATTGRGAEPASEKPRSRVAEEHRGGERQLPEPSDPIRAHRACWTACVQLVAPSTSNDRAKLLCEASEGFVYAIGVMGTTGERAQLQKSAIEISKRLKSITNKPVLVGIGVSNSEQAKAVSEVADGVVVGSALVRRVLEGEGPRGAYSFVADLRKAIDS